MGSFGLHPFHIVFASIPFAMAALILWLGFSKSVGGVVFIAFLAAFEFMTLASLRRDRLFEENRIVVFLRSLLVEPDKVK